MLDFEAVFLVNVVKVETMSVSAVEKEAQNYLAHFRRNN